VTVTTGNEDRNYEISTAPFTTGGVEPGRLLTITDVSDRESYRRRLEQRTEQLEALNRVVRHDIRNVMAVILSWSELLADHVDEEGTDALDRVVRKSQHVVELTELARDFVESLAGGKTVDLEPVNLGEMLESELATVRDSYPNATVEVSGELPRIAVGANQMLSSVFRNLFVNAVQHTHTETPVIRVTCEAGDSTVRVRVADNGPGIPAEQRDSLFGKGNKGIESAGTGIGLYLVKTLTEQYGGRVWFEENDPSGSVFVVELAKFGESAA
jgi:signal transduction histidine kinase